MFEEHGVVRSDHLIRIATDGQMQQDPNPVVEDGVAAGNSSGAASAHPDGTTAESAMSLLHRTHERGRFDPTKTAAMHATVAKSEHYGPLGDRDRSQASRSRTRWPRSAI